MPTESINFDDEDRLDEDGAEPWSCDEERDAAEDRLQVERGDARFAAYWTDREPLEKHGPDS